MPSSRASYRSSRRFEVLSNHPSSELLHLFTGRFLHRQLAQCDFRMLALRGLLEERLLHAGPAVFIRPTRKCHEKD